MTTPIGKQILVRPDELPEKDANGIFLPKNRIQDVGTVLAVSKDHEFDVDVGDRIKYLPQTREELEDGTILINGDSDTGVLLFKFN